MAERSNCETEIKLPLPSAAHGRRLLSRAGFRLSARRVLEQNTIYDTRPATLRPARQVLRVRASGSHTVLTFKGAAESGKHKVREELETPVDNREVMEEILTRLGYRPAFRYEKYRTEYRMAGSRGLAMLDETPAGVFLELEGSPAWIDRTARALGFSETDYITAGYPELGSQAGLKGDLVFDRNSRLRRPVADDMLGSARRRARTK